MRYVFVAVQFHGGWDIYRDELATDKRSTSTYGHVRTYHEALDHIRRLPAAMRE